jgi:hypothetical protein
MFDEEIIESSDKPNEERRPSSYPGRKKALELERRFFRGASAKEPFGFFVRYAHRESARQNDKISKCD